MSVLFLYFFLEKFYDSVTGQSNRWDFSNQIGETLDFFNLDNWSLSLD